MLHLVQDVEDNRGTPRCVLIHITWWVLTFLLSSHLDFDKISQFVTLVTAASAPIAPPVAILGLTYVFVQWLSTAVLENVYVSFPICVIWYLLTSTRPQVQRLLITYTVDLISVLKELFDITLKPDLALTTTWNELKDAFEAYERSLTCRRIHNNIYSTTPQDQILTVDSLSQKIRELLEE